MTRTIVGVVFVGILFAIFVTSHRPSHPASSATSSADASNGRFQVGQPGVGAVAPDIDLRSTAGGTFDLSTQRGKTVLLFFQEGVGCEPCWTQITDIERDWPAFKALGVDEMVSITTQSLGVVKQKVTDERISTPVLADPDLSASRSYHANDYGMMGSTMDGHTFVLVGPDGRIRWRADYGGAPHYTMYLPASRLVADMRAGLATR